MGTKPKAKELKVVVFCGGTGTRIWPMSRKVKPKQFQPLVGNSSMLRQAINHLLIGFEPEDIFISTGKEYAEIIVHEAPEIPLENLIVEPEMRDTAAAVGFVATVLSHRFPGCILTTLWGADHIIKNEKRLILALKAAAKLAQVEKAIVNVDTRPIYPNINLGYIEIGKMVKRVDGYDVFEVIRQIEKPNLERAIEFVKSWNFLWHTGYAVWSVDFMLSQYRKLCPEIYQSLMKIKDALETDREQEVTAKEYVKIPKISIDYSIYEKLKPGEQLDIPVDLGWSDVGAWNILKDEIAKSEEENVLKGKHIIIDTKDCLIYSNVKNKIIATIGLDGFVIVDTKDALLVCPKNRSQDVKKIVEKLKEEKKSEYL
jgi:mannose-1-phosphate guanylyltransferase